jgi:xanthine/CO dehydrogenase XdhC/CoxF family maturation factor
MTETFDALTQDDVLRTLATWRGEGRKLVINTWGSSPRPVGSQLGVDGDGNLVGSVSGGCIEGAVAKEALEAMQDGQPRLLEFGVSNEQAWEVGLACGGSIQVFVERLEG